MRRRISVLVAAVAAGSLLASAGQAQNMTPAVPDASVASSAPASPPVGMSSASASPNASSAASVPGPAPAPPAPAAPRKVVLILIDGVRQRELLGNALDDNGKPVRMSELVPNITALRKSGLFFSRMRISNPAGVSLPAYADIF